LIRSFPNHERCTLMWIKSRIGPKYACLERGRIGCNKNQFDRNRPISIMYPPVFLLNSVRIVRVSRPPHQRPLLLLPTFSHVSLPPSREQKLHEKWTLKRHTDAVPCCGQTCVRIRRQRNNNNSGRSPDGQSASQTHTTMPTSCHEIYHTAIRFGCIIYITLDL